MVPLHRSDGSGDTFVFTQYLSKQDPDGWGKSPGFGTTVDFPAVPGGLGENGASSMVTGCAATPGCVAYIGVSYLDQANQKGLGEAQLANASGNYLLPDAQSIGAEAASFASQTPANQVVSLINGPAADGYPMVNYEYAVVYSGQKDPATAQDDAGVPELGGDRRKRPLVLGSGAHAAAAGRGREAVRRPDRQDHRLSSNR